MSDNDQFSFPNKNGGDEASGESPSQPEPTAEAPTPSESPPDYDPDPVYIDDDDDYDDDDFQVFLDDGTGQPEEEEAGKYWYVVHCYSGHEKKVERSILQRRDTMGMKDRIFDVLVPTEEEVVVKDGKRDTKEQRIFPGYILVQMRMDEDSWYVIRNTPGVTGFVGMGNEPTPLSPDEVRRIINRMESTDQVVRVNFKIGDKVRIVGGPFNDMIGAVSNIDTDKQKVRVMVDFFGRETPVELDFLEVEPTT